ncbi:glycoside hydrolase domain-containing protein [Actinopolymorpha alba]|uniref:glycoside hydrolase domain-containing protein n=1 Tax=Actinopolymorpha alba TaxID=533267 RepID=UPI00039C8151|nr:glycoside hydrolase domain-containing protein [Actinopolymorpha alba]
MRRRVGSLLLTGLLTLAVAPAAQAGNARLDVWVENALRTVYRTSTIPESPVTAIRLTSARNEYESAQIVVRSQADLTINKVRFSDLVSRAGKVIARKNLRSHFVAYEDTATVQPNAFFPDRVGRQLYPRSAMPDPLSNEKSVQVDANSTQPIFVTSHVPVGTRPGTYDGTVTVETTRGSRRVPIQVNVFDATIPTAAKASFVNYHWTMTNGFTWDGMTWNGEGSQGFDVGKYYYGVETYSDDWFKLMDEFARTLTEYRTTMTWVRTDLFLQETGTDLSEFTRGIPDDLDWSLFDRYVETFRRRGFTGFANQHLIHALNKMPENEKPDDSWNTKLPDRLPVTDAFLENYLTALHRHLVEKGWTQEAGLTWYQHILDEPITDRQRNWWTYVARKIKEINARIGSDSQTMDADPNGILLDSRSREYVDTYVPLTPAFEAKKPEYKAEQAAGKDLWVYTCEVNTPPWLNRFWTQPTLTGRLLFWNLQRQGVRGHLHWAWNAWYVGPWNGDSYIVYPDRKNLSVKSSLRYEAQRDGLEDYELMHQLEKSNPELARRLVDSAVSAQDPRKYTLDPAYLTTIHDYLVRAVAGEDVGEVPAPTSPYADQDVPRTFLVDDAEGAITYTGEWSPRQRQYAYLGAVQSSTRADDRLSYEFYGSGIDVIVEKNNAAGKVAISVDNGPRRVVDLYEAVRYDYFTAYRARDLAPNQRHTIEIVNLDGKELRFDGLRVHRYDGQEAYDATLKSLDVTGVPSLDFDGRITTYRVIVPTERDAISVTPTLTDEGGSIEINGSKVESGTTVTAKVPTGKSQLNIRTTARVGRTTKAYHLNLVKGAVNAPDLNVARRSSGITASATRTGDGGITYGPLKMVDGDYGTMFASPQGYNDTHPFPHEIVVSWDQPQNLNTIVLATRGGLAQGLTDVDVQASVDGSTWETVARRIPFRWKRDDDDGVMEYSVGDLPELANVRKLRIQINDANYERWNMYAVYELEMYNLTDHGEIKLS